MLLLVGVTGAACGVAWERDPSAGRIERSHLPGIVLISDDAPAGTAYVHGASGFQDLETFALFLPASAVGTPGSASRLTIESVIVQGITGLFRSGSGADSALVRYVQDLRDRQIPDADEVRVDGLGDHAFGLVGETSDGADVLIFAWRVDNLVLAVSGSGAIEDGRVRAIADLVNGRALSAG
jgi:hypothetical protein